jgi:hypothetical protein
MRKIFFVLVFFCNYCFGQNLTVLKIDSNISIKLPAYDGFIDTTYDVTEDVKIRTIVASIDSGRIVFTKGYIDQNAATMKDEKALLKFYDGVKEGIMNTAQAELLTDSVIAFSNLKVQKLSLNLNYQGDACTLHYIGFLLNHYKYSFQILELASKRDKYGTNISDMIIFAGDLSFKRQLIGN